VRVAVVDIGSNSTRLLIADVDPVAGSVTELARQSLVTRLGAGVDAHGSLSEEAIARVMDALEQYRALIDREGVEANVAVLTAAAREADNGATFAASVRHDFGLCARVIGGEQEALLTFLGATHQLPSGALASPEQASVVIDIGGGSTEFIVGRGDSAGFHVSLALGVVRMSERHIKTDPPDAAELDALARDVRTVLDQGLPNRQRRWVTQGIAVAGTATSAAAIDQRLEPYDPRRVHGYVLSLETVKSLYARAAAMREAQRRELRGLHPDRAPTIVAGLAILAEAMRALALPEVTVSEHDILHGAALRLAQGRGSLSGQV
jgi:exopolyphosphatase / guanosine-5'-triphosphate,3'-diphosphate pyrophosphatase